MSGKRRSRLKTSGPVGPGGRPPLNFASSDKNAKIFKNVNFDGAADEVVPRSTILPFHDEPLQYRYYA